MKSPAEIPPKTRSFRARWPMTGWLIAGALAAGITPDARASSDRDGTKGHPTRQSASDLPPGHPLAAYGSVLGPLVKTGGLFDGGKRYGVYESPRGQEKSLGPALLRCDPRVTGGWVYLPHVVVTVEETGSRRVVGILQTREVQEASAAPTFMKASEERARALEPAPNTGWGHLEKSFAALTGPKSQYTPLSNREDIQIWSAAIAGGQVLSVIFHPVWLEDEKVHGLVQRVECLASHEALIMDDWDGELTQAPWKRVRRR